MGEHGAWPVPRGQSSQQAAAAAGTRAAIPAGGGSRLLKLVIAPAHPAFLTGAKAVLAGDALGLITVGETSAYDEGCSGAGNSLDLPTLLIAAPAGS